MSSDFRIGSTSSAHLDYGEDPDRGSNQQGDGSSDKDQQSKTYLDHQPEHQDDDAPRLKARKARKKKKKIAERNARRDSNHDQG